METQTQYPDVKTAAAIMFQGTSLPEQAIFYKEGEYWTVGRGGNAFRLKHTKGLGYLAHLLRHPAAEFHVLDLARRNRQPTRGGRNQSVRAWLAACRRGSRKGWNPYRQSG